MGSELQDKWRAMRTVGSSFTGMALAWQGRWESVDRDGSGTMDGRCVDKVHVFEKPVPVNSTGRVKFGTRSFAGGFTERT